MRSAGYKSRSLMYHESHFVFLPGHFLSPHWCHGMHNSNASIINACKVSNKLQVTRSFLPDAHTGNHHCLESSTGPHPRLQKISAE